MSTSEGSKNACFDPVCGRRVQVDQEKLPTAEYKKRKYYFCSPACREAFQKQTTKFRLNELARAGALLTPGKIRWGMS